MTRILRKNRNTQVLILVIVIAVVVFFFLVGGGDWIRGMTQGGGSMRLNHLNWGQILIGLVIGFLIGLLVSRRKW